jgi:hypothetical protein
MKFLLASISAYIRPFWGTKRQSAMVMRWEHYREITSQNVGFWCIFPVQMHLRHCRFALLIVLGLLLAPVTARRVCAQGDGQDRDVYQQKAGMIFAFLKQTKWPGRKMPGANVPFVVGIYGPDRVSAYLEELAVGQTVNGRAVMIKRISVKEELGSCHLIYVSGLDTGHVAAALRESRHENVLTVGDTANFNASGGVIQFSDEGGRVSYVASLDNARRERLELGGFLLKASGTQAKANPSPRKDGSAAGKDGSAAGEDDLHRAEAARLADTDSRAASKR